MTRRVFITEPPFTPPGVTRILVDSRAEWLANRQQDVTASAAGALLGVHEYQSAYGLWALKSGLITEDPDETPPMVRGRLLEPVALALLAEKHPTWTITKADKYYRAGAQRIGCTPDVFAFNPARGLGNIQIKTVEPSVFRKKWFNDQGEMEPPLWIVVQAIIEAKLTGVKWCAVAPMRVGFGLDIDEIDIPIRDDIWNVIVGKVEEFWRRVAAKDAYDPDYGRDGGLIARLNAPDLSLPPRDLSGDNELPGLIAEDETLKARIKLDGARRDEIKGAFIHKLGSHSSGFAADGSTIVRRRVHRDGYHVAPITYETVTVKAEGGRAARAATVAQLGGPF